MSFGGEITQEISLSNASTIIQDFIELPPLLPKNLIDHDQHHPKITKEQREKLIQKGRSLMVSIVNGKESEFPHKLEFLSHYKDLNDHWKLPGIAYGDRSQRKTILDNASYITIAPVYYLYSTAAACFWSSVKSSKENSLEVKTSGSDDSISNPCFEDISVEYKRQSHLESVVALIWALYDMSYTSGNAFVRGAIILDDSDQKIHDYLEKYCCLAGNVSFPEQLSSAVCNPWGSNLAYNRQGRSSHFVRKSITHYGLDTRFQHRNFALGVLPYAMTHLLFGRVMTTTGQEVTFIKGEEEGLGDFRAAAKHLINFALPAQNDHMRREKDIPTEIAEEFLTLLKNLQEDVKILNILKNSDAAGDRPWLLLNRLYQNNLVLSDLEKSENIDISAMYELILDIIETETKDPELSISKDVLLSAKSLLALLKQLYNPETLFMRTGNEVLFSDKELYGILDIPFVQNKDEADDVSEKKIDIT